MWIFLAGNGGGGKMQELPWDPYHLPTYRITVKI